METRSAEHVLTDERLIPIGKNDLPQVWDEVRPLLEAACERSRGECDLQTIVDELLDGRALMVAIVGEDGLKAVAVLEVRDHERGSAMWIKLAGGHESQDWSQHDDALKQLARHFGCAIVRVRGRKGWIKRLPHWRWVLEMDV